MSHISNTGKSLFLTIAVGLSALGSATIPAAAGFSKFIAPQAFPHPGGLAGSQSFGTTLPLKPKGPAVPATASKTVGSTQQKVLMPMGPYSPVGPKPANPYSMAGQKPQAPVYQKGSTAVSGCASSIPGACGNGTPPSPPSPPSPPQTPQTNPPTPSQTTQQSPGSNVIGLPPVVISPQQPVFYPQPVYVQRPQVSAVQQPAVVQAVPNTTTAAQEPCNCLTKQYLSDGSVLFRDLCTKEAAIATPAELKAQAQAAQ